MILNLRSRLMLIAPHPDDEALACSVVLQRAVGAGATVRVIYATDGDDNAWPQRVLERRWRINAADRKRWGELRRTEALAALAVLGVGAEQVKFLALPDQGLTSLLRNDCRDAHARLARAIGDWSPTHLLVPSVLDTHPDHNALAVLLRLIITDMAEPAMTVWSYAVHGRSAAFAARAKSIAHVQAEFKKKLAAILCHKTQLKLSRKRFLSYATRPERFLQFDPGRTSYTDGPICEAARDRRTLSIRTRLSPKLFHRNEPALLLLGRQSAGAVRCLKTQLPLRSAKIDLSDSRGRITAYYYGNAFAGELRVPIENFSQVHPLFVKVERRSFFFDEAGWTEVSPIVFADCRTSAAVAKQAFAIR